MAKIVCPHCKKITPITSDLSCIHCKRALRPLVPPRASDSLKVQLPIDEEVQEEVIEVLADDHTQVGQVDWQEKVQLIQQVNNPKADRPAEDIAGWLVVHDEQKQAASYDIYLGDNFFGTEAEGFAVDIPIQHDRYVSRSHANIRVQKDFLNRFQYQLLDDGTRRPKGPSLNGTYVNGHDQRLPKDQCIFLRDGDTIQVGETKLVFKTIDKSHNLLEAASEVLQSKYTSTVVFK